MNNKYLFQASDIIKAINVNPNLLEHKVVELIVLVREHLEVNRLRDMETTYFFCNWTLHGEIDRNPFAKIILKNINASVYKDMPNINDQINEVLSVKKFRKELVEIFQRVRVSSFLLNTKAGWESFLGVCLKSWIEKPLKLKKVEGKICVSEFWLEITNISSLDKNYVAEFNIKPNSVFWVARIFPRNYLLKGPLVLTEPDSSFSDTLAGLPLS